MQLAALFEKETISSSKTKPLQVNQRRAATQNIQKAVHPFAMASKASGSQHIIPLLSCTCLFYDKMGEVSCEEKQISGSSGTHCLWIKKTERSLCLTQNA